MYRKEITKTLDAVLPPIVWRSRWPEYKKLFGLPYTRKSMANLDSKGVGPERGMEAGKTYYTKEGYLSWLDSL